MYKQLIPIFLLACLTLLSCEKIDLSQQDAESEQPEGSVKVNFQISSIEQIPFENTTTKAASVSSLCTRFTITLFQEGTKIKTINQTAREESFGTISVYLQPGTYQLVAIAHNGLGNCTVSSPEKITFYNNKLTDTFYYYGALTISDACTEQLILKRPVSMFRLIITDTIPENVAQIKFYYTGGSSTFNAVTGFGCVQSRQTEIFNLSTLSSQLSTYEIYTFPHEANDFLDIKITALDSSGATIAEKTLGNIYIQPNVITQHTCRFFSDSTQTTTTFTLDNNGQWFTLLNQ